MKDLEVMKKRGEILEEVKKILVDNEATIEDIGWLFYTLDKTARGFVKALPAGEMLKDSQGRNGCYTQCACKCSSR